MTKAAPESSDSLVFECDFEEPPEKVWRALTEPRLLEAWLTAEEPSRTDSAKEFSRTDAAEESLRTGSAEKRPPPSRPRPQPGDYEVLTAEPHRLLRYRWRDRERARESGVGRSSDREVHSIVTFELAPGAAGGTHLRLTHGDFRIVSVAPSRTAARVTPITSARRRTRLLSFSGQTSWRRAA
jgi:uncharacterized protein YndB with AHSA1/START domain